MPSRKKKPGESFVIPAMERYAARVGAEKLNFKKWMVKEHKGNYYTEKVWISLDKEGAIWVGPKGSAEAHHLPTSVEVKVRPAEDQARRLEGTVYLLPSRRTGNVIMLQQRFSAPDGTKVFVPWTFYSTEGWLPMEPEDLLPFWKPIETRGRDRIMIHEGCKAARAAQEIADDPRSKHPWASELRLFEHWEMIGGALAPHRSNYRELALEKPSEVVYICDNDDPGKGVIREVSRRYHGTLKVVMFDPRWRESWDMADELPSDMVELSEDDRLGSRRMTLRQLMQPATHATIVSPPSGKGGKATISLNPTFAEEWVHIVTPEVYVHVDRPDDLLLEREFNNNVRPYSDLEHTATLLRTTNANKGRILRYDPSVGQGLYRSVEEQRFFNTYVPSPIKARAGDAGPWTEFMEWVFPEEGDRLEVYRWVSTLVCRPEIKMGYGLLLLSAAQGVGKGTLAEKILMPIVGMRNCSVPSEEAIVDSSFNDWAAHKRLAICHEIYAGHSAKAYNRLKTYISEETITVNKKYQVSYTIQNWLHIVACSNEKRALQLSTEDRRWLVPRVVDEKRKPEYWDSLISWLRKGHGLEIIVDWCRRWLEEQTPVMPSAVAPWSSTKQEVIEEGFSPGMQLVSAFLVEVRERMNGEPVIIVDTSLVEAIKSVIYEGRITDKLERPLTVRKVALANRYHVGDHRIPFSVRWGQGPTNHARMILSSKNDVPRTAAELEKEGRKPLDVAGLMRTWGMSSGL
jgi:effector-binding domain-containing protein